MQSLCRILSEARDENQDNDDRSSHSPDDLNEFDSFLSEFMKGVRSEGEYTNEIMKALAVALKPDLEPSSDCHEVMAGEGDDEQIAAFEEEFGDDEDGLKSNRQNKNFERTWQRLWKGKQ